MLRTKLSYLVPIMLAFLLLAGSWLIFKFPFQNSATIPQGKTHEVFLDQNGFSPAEIEIKPGDFIEFTTRNNEPFWPASDLHPTHGIYPEFDPLKPVDPNKSWTFQFLKTGRWKYHDHLQPVYRGVIKVTP